ncbi:hypothetical protein GCM10007425_07370 [Lysinibacillus alkalisoli]|uniref:Uncharacterized protein n=1 Tax=Lysinibacillus alkalisoli TaxID=1911548 RepID=A0A917LEF2_9BACI|nr:hypothetical protein [Lysinibacillus alkalisoli]GGG15603.1 hypothetical protein GCM10007425_07370 [Lysinibacillus alkalisoli]
MHYVYYVLGLLPVAFLFHHFEYRIFLREGPDDFIIFTWIAYMVIAGFCATFVRKREVSLVNAIAFVLSFVLAMLFMPKEASWFKGFQRNDLIIIIAMFTYIGQLTVRSLLRLIVHKPTQI